MTAPLARNALLLGNFVTGTAVLAPAGMLNELSAGLGVSLQAAGWLVTFGAVVLCFGRRCSPGQRRTLTAVPS